MLREQDKTATSDLSVLQLRLWKTTVATFLEGAFNNIQYSSMIRELQKTGR